MGEEGGGGGHCCPVPLVGESNVIVCFLLLLVVDVLMYRYKIGRAVMTISCTQDIISHSSI